MKKVHFKVFLLFVVVAAATEDSSEEKYWQSNYNLLPYGVGPSMQRDNTGFYPVPPYNQFAHQQPNTWQYPYTGQPMIGSYSLSSRVLPTPWMFPTDVGPTQSQGVPSETSSSGSTATNSHAEDKKGLCYRILDLEFPLFSEYCAVVPQANYMLPNLFGHKTKEEANELVSALNSTYNSACYSEVRRLVCPLLFPACDEEPIVPCINLCQTIKSKCTDIDLSMISCDGLPETSAYCPAVHIPNRDQTSGVGKQDSQSTTQTTHSDASSSSQSSNYANTGSLNSEKTSTSLSDSSSTKVTQSSTSSSSTINHSQQNAGAASEQWRAGGASSSSSSSSGNAQSQANINRSNHGSQSAATGSSTITANQNSLSTTGSQNSNGLTSSNTGFGQGSDSSSSSNTNTYDSNNYGVRSSYYDNGVGTSRSRYNNVDNYQASVSSSSGNANSYPRQGSFSNGNFGTTGSISKNTIVEKTGSPFGIQTTAEYIAYYPEKLNLSKCEPLPTTNPCTMKGAQYYAIPQNPNCYIQCIFGFMAVKPCPYNLVWNPRISVCDWPTLPYYDEDDSNAPRTKRSLREYRRRLRKYGPYPSLVRMDVPLGPSASGYLPLNGFSGPIGIAGLFTPQETAPAPPAAPPAVSSASARGFVPTNPSFVPTPPYGGMQQPAALSPTPPQPSSSPQPKPVPQPVFMPIQPMRPPTFAPSLPAQTFMPQSFSLPPATSQSTMTQSMYPQISTPQWIFAPGSASQPTYPSASATRPTFLPVPTSQQAYSQHPTLQSILAGRILYVSDPVPPQQPQQKPPEPVKPLTLPPAKMPPKSPYPPFIPPIMPSLPISLDAPLLPPLPMTIPATYIPGPPPIFSGSSFGPFDLAPEFVGQLPESFDTQSSPASPPSMPSKQQLDTQTSSNFPLEINSDLGGIYPWGNNFFGSFPDTFPSLDGYKFYVKRRGRGGSKKSRKGNNSGTKDIKNDKKNDKQAEADDSKSKPTANSKSEETQSTSDRRKREYVPVSSACIGRPLKTNIPHPTDSTKYIFCINENKYEIMNCPNGFVYHSNKDQCEKTKTSEATANRPYVDSAQKETPMSSSSLPVSSPVKGSRRLKNRRKISSANKKEQHLLLPKPSTQSSTNSFYPIPPSPQYRGF